MIYRFAVDVKGDFACFTRPELKVERMSYDFITPSAAVGLLESVYWHPPITYAIDRIHVLNRIKFMTVRMNELKSKASARAMKAAIAKSGKLPYINRKTDIQQRTSTILSDVHYVIEAHFELDASKLRKDENFTKFKEILDRKLHGGECFQQPYLGLREHAARVSPYEGDFPVDGYYAHSGERDFGLVLYGMNYDNLDDITPMFYRAVMRDGVIDVAGSEVYR